MEQMGTSRELSSLKTCVQSCFEEVSIFPFLLQSFFLISFKVGELLLAAGVAALAQPQYCSQDRFCWQSHWLLSQCGLALE